MRYNILIGGAAGQGINKITQMMSEILNEYGYFTFNYRDYQSLIRGGHNFNILNFSNVLTSSIDKYLDVIVALDNNTIFLHKKELKKGGIIIKSDSNFSDSNLNLFLLGSLSKYFDISKDFLIKIVKKYFNNESAINSVLSGFDYQNTKIKLKKNKNKIENLSGSSAIALSAKESKLNFYFTYPMTPSTGVMTELVKYQNNNLSVFQAENEIAVSNIALGTSFAGKLTMVGTSGGGFDLMAESLSFQGISEIPLTVYLASRPGPGTGVPTYTLQSDLNIALYSGHGEFHRIVCAPGDPLEAFEKTNELLYLSEKHKVLSIILSDKHLSESEYSFLKKVRKILSIKINRDIPGNNKIVKTSSYETNIYKNSTEDSNTIEKNVDKRLNKILDIEKDLENFVTYKIHGKKKTNNLIVGWGSTKGVIIDSIKNLDCKFLQILYLSPFPKEIEKELKKFSNIIIIENNSTSQLSDLIRQKTGIEIKNKILKYDGRPFYADELNKEIKKILK